MGCGLASIEECFSEMVALRSLNLGENNITQIKNLNNCVMLEKLHLYSNGIEQINGL